MKNIINIHIINSEWVRITSVQPKADELRCDGFISIPDQYLKNKKKKRKQSDNPEKQKEINDMRRASEMYRNTFDENESIIFILSFTIFFYFYIYEITCVQGF